MRLIIPIRAYSWPPFFSIQKCLSKRLAVIRHEVSKHYGCASAVIGDKQIDAILDWTYLTPAAQWTSTAAFSVSMARSAQVLVPCW